MYDNAYSNSAAIALALLSLIAILFAFAPAARAADPADVDRCIKHEGPGSEAMCRHCGDYGPNG
jgi:hypothetical protein